ncbi:unnamed protein product [Vitrella brassicaformis CCMP3155]|uniref:Uncharacterized protein n=2 Tax=Vitrella brassicaformis TaxID=1169539 RepID=A0A0G4GS37_VITBC|nr:unnamed protein product [Vitrella brassicaformis CCMP3155]|eukprot:CEM33440.1 unnamed protein product [Vitrella brassicaformis CCMP3155]
MLSTLVMVPYSSDIQSQLPLICNEFQRLLSCVPISWLQEQGLFHLVDAVIFVTETSCTAHQAPVEESNLNSATVTIERRRPGRHVVRRSIDVTLPDDHCTLEILAFHHAPRDERGREVTHHPIPPTSPKPRWKQQRRRRVFNAVPAEGTMELINNGKRKTDHTRGGTIRRGKRERETGAKAAADDGGFSALALAEPVGDARVAVGEKGDMPGDEDWTKAASEAVSPADVAMASQGKILTREEAVEQQQQQQPQHETSAPPEEPPPHERVSSLRRVHATDDTSHTAPTSAAGTHYRRSEELPEGVVSSVLDSVYKHATHRHASRGIVRKVYAEAASDGFTYSQVSPRRASLRMSIQRQEPWRRV